MTSSELGEQTGPTGPLSPMHSRTGYQLIKVGELAMAAAERALEPLGVRPRHLNVLATLAAGEAARATPAAAAPRPEALSQQEVSQLLGIDPNVLVGVIDDLERHGLAQRRRNPRDRRRHVVAVTERGRELLREGSHRLDRAEAEFLADIPDADLAVVRRVAAQLLASHHAPLKR